MKPRNASVRRAAEVEIEKTIPEIERAISDLRAWGSSLRLMLGELRDAGIPDQYRRRFVEAMRIHPRRARAAEDRAVLALMRLTLLYRRRVPDPPGLVADADGVLRERPDLPEVPRIGLQPCAPEGT